MSKQIPTTVFVPPFPSTPGVERDDWSRAVAGFCNGTQAVKIDDESSGKTIYSVRNGAVIHVQGVVEIIGTSCNLDILPVTPRMNGFINAYNTQGDIFGVAITKDSKVIDMCSLDEGTYYISGNYLASLKERV